MNAYKATHELLTRLASRGITLDFDQANTLRRAQLTLHRWAELECGDGNEHQSWAIERDETTNKPYMCYYPHQSKSRRSPIADRETGALKRIATLCKSLGIHFYHQGDPRGCALYVSKEPLTDQNYSGAGVAIY